MKKITTTLLLTTLTIGGLAIADTSMARYGDSQCGARGMQERMHSPGKMAEFGRQGKGLPGILRLEKKLDLSKAQRTAIHEIMKNARTAKRVHRDALSDNRLALYELMEVEEFNEQEMRRLVRIKADNMTELMLLRAKTRAAIRAQLTDVQREKLSELHQNRGFARDFGRRL